LRTGDDPPLRTVFRRGAQKTCPSQELPTPRHPQSGPNDMSPTRSRPFTANWQSRSSDCCRAARSAHAPSHETFVVFYDTVRLVTHTHQIDDFRANIVRVGLNYKFGYAAAPAVYK